MTTISNFFKAFTILTSVDSAASLLYSIRKNTNRSK